jgi:type IV secretion system protein VirB3
MDTSTEELRTDPLFVGLTRPATLAGIPYAAFMVELMAVTLAFLAVGNPLVLAVALPVHFVLYLISAADPAIFGSIAVWMKTCARCRNTRFWGAATFSPLSPSRWNRY